MTSVVTRTFTVVAALAVAGAAVAEERAAWSERSWQSDLGAELGADEAAHPGARERLLRLDGLQPEVYLKRRRPEPEVSTELSRLVQRGEVPASLVSALLVDELGGYPFSTAERFPAEAKGSAARLMRMEREQLRAGLMLALGESRHGSASHVLGAILFDGTRGIEERRVAAIALGKTRDARAEAALSRVIADEKARLELVAASLAGLGHIRTPSSVAKLVEESKRAADPALQQAVAAALGNAASSWALRGEDAGVADEMRKAAALALVELLARADDAAAAGATIDALQAVAHEAASDRLRALADDNTRPALVRDRAVRAHQRLERALERAAR